LANLTRRKREKIQIKEITDEKQDVVRNTHNHENTQINWEI
jgi:hypothetical protein